MSCNTCNKEICNCNLQAVGCNTDKCDSYVDAQCVIYNRECDLNVETLDCIGVPCNTNLRIILQKIDEKLCTIINADDIFSKVSENDTTTGYLEDKIVAGSCFTITKLNPGANESLELSPLIDPDADNIIECRAGGLFAEATVVDFLIAIDDTDTCPNQYLDPKFANPISDLTGEVGVGGHCGSIIVHGIPAPGLTSTNISDITIAGTVYANPSVDPVNDCDELIDQLNNILTINSLPYFAYSTGSTLIAASQTSCGVCISGIASGDVVDINGFTTTLNLPDPPIITPFTVNFPYSTDALDPTYFKRVYKKIEDDGAGCKTLSFYAYEGEKPDCNPVNENDITLLGYAGTDLKYPTLYVDIDVPVEPGVNYVIDIVETVGGIEGNILLRDFVIKGDNIAIIPLVNHNSTSDIKVTVRKDCGCCSGYSAPVSKTRAAIADPTTSACDTNGWLPVPPASLRNGWLGSNLLYKIEDNVIEFRGEIFKIDPQITLSLTVYAPEPYISFGELTEEILDVASIDPVCIPSINSTNFGMVESHTQLSGSYAYSSFPSRIDRRTVDYQGFLRSNGLSLEINHTMNIERFDPNNQPAPSVDSIKFNRNYIISMEGRKLYI